MAIPINEDPYSIGAGGVGGYATSSQFWCSLDNLANDVQLAFYRPESIDAICAMTKFSRREVQVIYRSFKQVCPTGIVSLAQFQEIFNQFFPYGNPKRYAELVFRTFDHNNDNRMSFEEFVVGLSIMQRGTTEEKFDWIFSLYDLHKRDRIGEQELFAVTYAVYDLLARNPYNHRRAFARADVRRHTANVFGKLCLNGQTQIERSRFVEYCMSDPQIRESLALFDTIL